MKVVLIDKLNIGLIVVSAVLAYFFPLSLFIFAYAILGPLHYLTEINWLDGRKYFFTNKSWIWLSISLLVTVVIVIPKFFIEYGSVDSALVKLMSRVNEWSNSVIFISLIIAIAYQFVKKIWIWVLVLVLATVGSVLLNKVETYTVLVGLFIPTIIHVYLFTILFMIYGAKKSQSKMGYWAVAIGIIVPVFFVFLPVSSDLYSFSKSFKDIYLDNGFHVVPVIFSKYLGISEGKTFFFYEPMELRLMMFMSFIYCYHYLNWFSKTTVIQWHQFITIKKSIIMAIIWLLCLSLFYIDFRFGFLFALSLSFLHVIVEFPLNALSIKGIFSKPEV